MLDWLAANAGTLLVLAILLFIVCAIVRSLRRKKGACSCGCGGSCASCPSCESCAKRH